MVKQPKSPNELNDILENLVKMHQEAKAINEIIESLRNVGFNIDAVPKPDQEHFGNWVLLAFRPPLVIRVISDRGELGLDVSRSEILNPVLYALWITWDVVAECIGVLYNARAPLDSLLSNLDAVTKAFSSENWPLTKERLKEIEQVKRQRFMEAKE